jgi:hypothetical protein
MMEALCSSETSIVTRAPRRNVPEDTNLEKMNWSRVINGSLTPGLTGTLTVGGKIILISIVRHVRSWQMSDY